jgi:hypothetical protein
MLAQVIAAASGYKSSDKRRRDRRGNPELTPGQAFDIADAGMDASRGLVGGGTPFGAPFATFAGLDLAISAGTAKPGEAGGKFAGAFAAQAAGLGAWYLGGTAGLIGSVVGGFVGGALGGPAGVELGATVGGLVGKWGTRLVAPFVLDPYIRRISRPINRLVGIAQHRANFGRGFQDSTQAWTLRQQSEQELRGSLLNAMQYIGREAQLMHQ